MPDSKPELTVESKSIQKRPRSATDEIRTIQRLHVSPPKRRMIQKELEIRRVQLTMALRKAIGGVMDGSLKKEAAMDDAADAMIGQFTLAYEMGIIIAGVKHTKDSELADWQVDDLMELLNAELDYFSQFVEDVAKRRGSEAPMNHDIRAGLYGGSVNSAFWRGWLGTLPENAQITWRRTVAESCATCIGWALGNPYSLPSSGKANPLPSVPGNGDSICKTACKCFLEATEGEWFSGLKNHVGVEVTMIGRLEVDPDSPGAIAAAQLYQDLANRYAWLKRLAQLDAAFYGPMADAALADLRERARLLGHEIDLTVTVSEITEPISIAEGAKYRWIDMRRFSEPGFLDDLVTVIAVVVALNDADRGKITAVQAAPPMITLEGNRQYRLDAVGMNILFVDEG